MGFESVVKSSSTPFPVGGAPMFSSSPFFRFEADRDELRQSRPLVVQDPERRVASAGHRSGLFGDMSKEVAKFEVRLQEQGRLKHPSERVGVLDRSKWHQFSR
jgi:hypothetical protein